MGTQRWGFPFGKIHGNFIASEMLIMVGNFLKEHHLHIDNCVDRIMEKALQTNSDILTKGRQTFCPFTNQSVTSATAYRRFYEFLVKNTGELGMSCLEWVRAICLMFEKDTIECQTMVEEIVEEDVYDEETTQKMQKIKKVKRLKWIRTKSKEETREMMFKLLRRFASYIKHNERAKKDRRVISSAGMGLRMFLYIIEEFHLELAK